MQLSFLQHKLELDSNVDMIRGMAVSCWLLASISWMPSLWHLRASETRGRAHAWGPDKHLLQLATVMLHVAAAGTDDLHISDSGVCCVCLTASGMLWRSTQMHSLAALRRQVASYAAA